MTIPENYMPFGSESTDRDELIERYFHLGFSYKEITMFLCVLHDINVSVRHLKRILRHLQLTRRKFKDDVDTVIGAIEQELRGSAFTLGYRSMHRRLHQVHGIVTDRETVRSVLKILDFDGVLSRSQRRLRRRDYSVKGPNYLWHIDGWDKLKPYGFSVHGCIDGFSRKVLWLEVSASNKNPYGICTNFVSTIMSLRGIPYVIRADRGTENVNVEIMQESLRESFGDSRARLQATFLYGKSTANQRIEAWWSKFKQQGMAFWINHFKELVDSGIMDTSSDMSIKCARFCYMELLRKELNLTVQLWNTHPMRKSRNNTSPNGKPDVMYTFPEMYGACDYLRQLNEDDLLPLAEALTADEPECNDRAYDLFKVVMEEENLQMPRNISEADDLFVYILDTIDAH